MKKTISLSLALLFVSGLSAWQLGKNCTIVLPEKPYNATVKRALKTGADALKQSLADSGIKAVIKTAAAPVRKADTINLGFPDGKKYTYFSGGITFEGKTVFISGNDRLARKSGRRNSYYTHYLGSIKALTVFMEQYLNARFTFPGPSGIGKLPGKLPELPVRKYQSVTPALTFATGRHYDLLYDYSNNNFGMGSTFLYGGHSHYSAIPIARYGKTNPEYFSLLDGMRSNNQKYYSYCHSNPAVRELIYKEMLKKLDAGAEMVELAQTDGYRGCTCKKCSNLFGTTSESEKVWIMHRQMAERLMKDRPGKKVVIISYNPTDIPPQTFRKFPENTMIELCRYSPEDFKEWKKYEVPQGFMVYIYNWGFYQLAGITPKFSPAKAAEQVKLFRKNNVRAIYRCGFGELFGLEGPVYYVYGKMLDDPSQNYDKLVQEYCQASFGPGAGSVMKHFYNKLYAALDEVPVPKRDPVTKKAPDPVRYLTAVYSPGLINELDDLLKGAEGQITEKRAKDRLKLVRIQFDYLRNLMTILYFYDAYKLKPSYELLNVLLDTIDARNKMISDILKGKMKRIPGISASLFGITRTAFPVNGRNSGVINTPLTWNVETIRKFKVLPGTSSKAAQVSKARGPVGFDFDKGAWKGLKWHHLAGIQLGKITEKSRFKVTFDKNNFYVAVESELNPKHSYKQAGKDAKCWKWDCMELVIDPWGSRQKYFHFIINPVQNSFYDAAVGMIDDPLHPLYGQGDPAWNGKWSYKTRRKGKLWQVLFTIPFKTLESAVPTRGTKWTFNVCRQAIINPEARAVLPELSCWSPCFEASSFHEKSTFGQLNFN